MMGARVHLEQLNDHLITLIVDNSQRHIHIQIGSRSRRAKVDAWVYETFAVQKESASLYVNEVWTDD